MGAGWSAEVVDALSAAVRRSLGRLLLIRRPGRRQVTTTRAWAVTQSEPARSGEPGSRRATCRSRPHRSAHPCRVRPVPGSARPVSQDPVLLVCAHGLHDTCCAVRGRPVATALARRWPAATWECSHVRGDGFAANVVVLPNGTYYGGLDADSATDVVAGHLDGRLDPTYLRGRSGGRPRPRSPSPRSTLPMGRTAPMTSERAAGPARDPDGGASTSRCHPVDTSPSWWPASDGHPPISRVPPPGHVRDRVQRAVGRAG